ncbi:hypothetical protein M427DRAFT_437306 [Gonapodya prolifera JEL478]|uniref:Leucine-rich repeat-containing N-terminal plant-type domain-containing protein n=1 Tax=Gonapodya prolifera (strain JEL478) TaxID=1344416 RepID=A0A139A3T8_GONPJ|nr:hypothetical protein M427DRAFT_437306 [Gonapodya prolifera JEL478]|eukprot:KXS11450.1 hypothetical protein M427DRAFT_437306 [Gonapodya prolifera JEL478]
MESRAGGFAVTLLLLCSSCCRHYSRPTVADLTPKQARDCGPLEQLFAQSNRVIPWTIGSCCAYSAFNCTDGRVTTVSLGSSFLVGNIPSLSVLTQLQYLDLSGNELTGGIPSL